ncbi:MAG: histidine kinase [Bacteroidia bacterium]
MPVRILFLEDSSSDVELMKHELKKAGIIYISEWVETEAGFIKALQEFNPDVILSDYSLPSFDGMKAFRLFKAYNMMIPFILVTANMSEQLALDCLSEGVDDFILKSNFVRVPKSITRVIEKMNIQKEKDNISRELIQSQVQLRALVNEIQEVRENERAHIAREIHDELGQQLTALKMDIGWVLSRHPDGDSEVNGKLAQMLALSDGIIDTVRRISSELRPAIIDDLGLTAALEWKCNDFNENSGVRCNFSSNVKERKFSNALSINFYRVLQEALTNVMRHASATRVDVCFSENESELVLEIIDNGKGMVPDTGRKRKALGILGMKERAALLGGVLNIISTKDKGTHIILNLPPQNGNSDN